MNRYVGLWSVVLCIALCGACGRSDNPAAADVVRTDSAGIRLVTSGAEDRALTWQFEEVSTMRDSTGETMLFDGIDRDDIVIDRASRTYVLVSEPAILRFTRDGVQDLSIGRSGSAPGEMRRPSSLGVQGDSLVVHDSERDALVRFGATFEPINDIPLREAYANASRVAFRTGGVFIERHVMSGGSTTALFADTSATNPIASIAEPRGAILSCGGGAQRIAVMVPKLFGPALWWATNSGRLLVNATPRYEVNLYEGPRLIASVRRDIPLRAPTVAEVPRLYPEGIKLPIPGANCEWPSEVLAKEAGMTDTLPLVNGVALLSDGTIWVRRSFPGERPVVLDVFGSDGAYVGTVRDMALPAARYPNGDLLVVREDTASGGQHIVRYRVTR